MEKDSGKIFRELKDDVSTYVELKLELLKLSTIRKKRPTDRNSFVWLNFTLSRFFGYTVHIFGPRTLSRRCLQSMGAGFAVVAGLYFLLIGLVVLNKNTICRMIINIVLAALNDNDDNDDATDQQQSANSAGETDF